MSESEAKIWLRDHGGLIPALNIYHNQAQEILLSETASRADLAAIIALDPGMSISLFNQINRKMDAAKRPKHETVHSALGLLGEDAISEFITRHETLTAFNPSTEMHKTYHQLASQGFHLMTQLVRFVEIQGMQPLNEIRTAGLLHNVGELAVCLFDFDLYRDYNKNLDSIGSSGAAAKTTLGFNFNDLGKLLVGQWRLPYLVAESLDISANISRNARMIQLAANISQQAETSWHHDAMKSAVEVSASFLNQNPTSLEKVIKSSAIESARKFAVADVFPAAARLILLPDIVKQPTAEKTPQTSPVMPSQLSLQDRIKSLVNSPAASQSSLTKLLTDGLYDDLKFSRVAMILFSKDGSTLTTRLGNGLSEDSPFRKLKIETASSGLFKSLLSKPQALWVNPTNYKKFDTLLPGAFKATCMCDNFFLMSLFVGNKAIGFIYCDRSAATISLDESVYENFKSCALMTSKALTYVAQRGSKSTA
jgi:HD-like signal output (HDOD) protein